MWFGVVQVVRGGAGAGRAEDSRVEEFQRLRPLLFSIAYRILGSVSVADRNALADLGSAGDAW